MADLSSRTRLTLETEQMSLTLLPDLGGSVGALTYKGQNILRPLRGGTKPHPLETAGFPLFPFSGRICNGQFSWKGRDISLAPNFRPEPHAIHGQAWLAPWDVSEQSPSSVRLAYQHDAGDWPWPYLAEQVFHLRSDGLDLDLRLTNQGSEAMPAGLGWHPYFPRMDARVKIPVDRIWTAKEGMIPDQLNVPATDADLSDWRPVNALDLDNAFSVSDQISYIEWPGRGLRVEMKADPMLSHVVVYTPEGQDFFCVEPVSHSPDAVNSGHSAEVTGLQSLAPGETLSARIRLTIVEM